MPHFSSQEWCEMGKYHDSLPKKIKYYRLLWEIVSAILFRPVPYFIGKQWRRRLLTCFGAYLGKKVSIAPSARIWMPQTLTCGEYVAIDRNVYLYSVAPITIGSKVAISDGAFICTASHDISKASRPLITAPITIEDGAWIGAEAFICPGVTIGEGAVVGARAVVTRNVPAWAVVAGNPARIIKTRILETSLK